MSPSSLCFSFCLCFYFCFLVITAVPPAQATWVLLQDLREYNTSLVSMPVTATTDAVPTNPAPTTVLATRFTIARWAIDCSNLVVDLGLVRTVGVNIRVPKYVSMWLWSGSLALESGTFSSPTTLVWSGNVTVPLSLSAVQSPNTSVLATHRFILPAFSPPLVPNAGYWLGVTIGIDRAYHSTSKTFNEVRWATASTGIPSTRLATAGIHRVVDRFGNGIALRHPVLINWTSALVSEAMVLQPAGVNTSVTHRLASMVTAHCTGPLDLTNPAILPEGPPQPYGTNPTPVPRAPSTSSMSSAPAPSSSPNSIPIPIPSVPVSPSAPISGPSARVSMASPTTWISPQPSVSLPSAPVPSAPVPVPVSLVVSATGDASPVYLSSYAIPSPLGGAVKEKEKEKEGWLLNWESPATISLVAFTCLFILCLIVIVLYLFSKSYKNSLGKNRVLARDGQGKFSHIHDVTDEDVDSDGDITELLSLDSQSGGGDGDAGEKDVTSLYRDIVAQKVPPLGGSSSSSSSSSAVKPPPAEEMVAVTLEEDDTNKPKKQRKKK
jgi:cbb3-type cytochrome oxidase subunit 3